MELKKELIHQVQEIISSARARAIRSVDTERVLMYWQLGKVIFEEEQQGKDRAGYGDFLIESLSNVLVPQFGTSFSYRQLNWFRQFYRTFPIVNTVRSQFSWTHYRTLIRIDNLDNREFYIAETSKNNKTIFASKYQLYLPSEQQLINEVKKEMDRMENHSIKVDLE